MPPNADSCSPTCGDGRTVGATETCDDGNNNQLTITASPGGAFPSGPAPYAAGSDGCANCKIVPGWYCINSTPYTKS